jgi:hypothetical protein
VKALNVQIGMSCDPRWLCDGIEWFIGLVVLLIVLGLIRTVVREKRRNSATKGKTHRIHLEKPGERTQKKRSK